MLVVGLTGGIACGKSTVSKRLEEKHKLPLVDADRIAREIVEPHESAYNQIVDYFKDLVPELLLTDGHLNRGALGKWVFENPEDLKKLNSITHPAVRHTIFKQIFNYYARGYRMCILDVPLLFEAGLDTFCGITITVVSDEETQLERLLARNSTMTLEEARNRIRAQMTSEERIERTDYVIENSKDLENLYRQVDELVTRIKPSFLRTALEYFPPFGAVSAAAIILSKSFFNNKKLKKN